MSPARGSLRPVVAVEPTAAIPPAAVPDVSGTVRVRGAVRVVEVGDVVCGVVPASVKSAVATDAAATAARVGLRRNRRRRRSLVSVTGRGRLCTSGGTCGSFLRHPRLVLQNIAQRKMRTVSSFQLGRGERKPGADKKTSVTRRRTGEPGRKH